MRAQTVTRAQLAKLALDETLAAGAFLLGRRSYEWLAARGHLAAASWRTG